MSVINLREYMKRVYTELENYIEGLSEEERVRFVTEFHDMFDSGTADYDDEHINRIICYEVCKSIWIPVFKSLRRYICRYE